MAWKFVIPVLFSSLVFAMEYTSEAAVIFTQTQQGDYQPNQLYGTRWDNFTGKMTAAHTIVQGASFDTALGGYDAVWVDQELYGSLSAGEIASLTAYATSGGRIVMIGENDSWNTWNASILSVVGGGFLGVCDWSIGARISNHELVSGVTEVTMIQSICGSLLTGAGSPDILFDNNLAAVYTVGSGDVLVILDSNWNDDGYISRQQNELFADNIVEWLEGDAVIPEPSSFITGAGLALCFGLAGWRRKRRRQAA